MSTETLALGVRIQRRGAHDDGRKRYWIGVSRPDTSRESAPGR
jgi:hypothetical protein